MQSKQSQPRLTFFLWILSLVLLLSLWLIYPYLDLLTKFWFPFLFFPVLKMNSFLWLPCCPSRCPEQKKSKGNFKMKFKENQSPELRSPELRPKQLNYGKEKGQDNSVTITCWMASWMMRWWAIESTVAQGELHCLI